jgi:hypothetical protein
MRGCESRNQVESFFNNYFPFLIMKEWLWWPAGLMFGVMRVENTVAGDMGWFDTIH